MARDDHRDGRGATTPGPDTRDERPVFVADRERPDGEDDETIVVNDLEAEFKTALDLNTWTAGERMDQLAERLEREVELAAGQEQDMGPRILETLKKVLPTAPDASRESGVYQLQPDHVTGALRNVLFNGNVEACDGTRVMVPTLPVTVIQIGICLSSYQGTGDSGSIAHRLYRHDIMRKTGNAEDQVIDFLQRRARRRKNDPSRAEFGDDGRELSPSDMLCRALMIYAERAMLVDRSTRAWRIGHGGPMPHEMIVGSGRQDLARASLDVLSRLLIGHKHFIFVPSEISDDAVITIANCMGPLQYAVLRDTKDIIEGYIAGSSYERPHYKRSGLYDAVRAFQADVGSKVVLGVYRASILSPGRVFYAHEDHVHQAAQIIIADSVLQECRGFPNLIDIADRTCKGMFEPGGVAAQVHAVLARAGSPFRFLNERSTRT